jgi:cytochrome P450
MVETASQMVDVWEESAVRDLHTDMTQLTLEVVTRVLFGATVADRAVDVSTGLKAMMEEFTWHANLSFILPDFFPLPISRRMRRGIRLLDDVFYSLIEERRGTRSESNDLLGALLKVRYSDGHGMSDRELRDEMMTLLLAGHETTAVSLSWTWYLLALNKQAEAKLHQEIDEVLGDRDPTVADIPRLRYTDWVVKESMRIYPLAWGIGRKALRAFEIGPYRLPAGTNIFLMPWITHRDERFYPEPDCFRPERWDPLNQDAELPHFAYFPFGGGPRKCIGASFAQMESVLLLVTLARRLRFDLVAEDQAEILPSLSLRPRFGFRMVPRKRSGQLS